MKDAEEAWGKEGYGGLSRWVACQLGQVPDDDQIDIAQNLLMRQLGRKKWREEPFSEEIAEREGAYGIFAHLERAYKRNGGARGRELLQRAQAAGGKSLRIAALVTQYGQCQIVGQHPRQTHHSPREWCAADRISRTAYDFAAAVPMPRGECG